MTVTIKDTLDKILEQINTQCKGADWQRLDTLTRTYEVLARQHDSEGWARANALFEQVRKYARPDVALLFNCSDLIVEEAP